MNKKIKRIIAVGLAVNALSIIEPVKYLNLTTTKAHADDYKGTKLKKISLGTGSIDFSSSKTEYTVQLDSSVDELKVCATPADDEATVTINGSDASKEGSEYRDTVKLEKGTNTITICVQKKAQKKKYILTVMRGKEKQIYLESISLSAGDINFSRDQTDYNITVPADTNDISIKAVPENNVTDEEINKITTNDDENYKETVKLSNGNNDIPITIKDDDDHEKTYTLHINRVEANTKAKANNAAAGTNTEKTNAANKASSTSTTAKGWASNNGQWIYNDENGNKAVGWKQINNIWYYFGSDGIMKTGWQNVNGEWYYLNNNGAMKTGWFEDSNGKWYFLNNSGAMAKDTTIGKYKLDSSGAWIK